MTGRKQRERRQRREKKKEKKKGGGGEINSVDIAAWALKWKSISCNIRERQCICRYPHSGKRETEKQGCLGRSESGA